MPEVRRWQPMPAARLRSLHTNLCMCRQRRHCIPTYRLTSSPQHHSSPKTQPHLPPQLHPLTSTVAITTHPNTAPPTQNDITFTGFPMPIIPPPICSCNSDFHCYNLSPIPTPHHGTNFTQLETPPPYPIPSNPIHPCTARPTATSPTSTTTWSPRRGARARR